MWGTTRCTHHRDLPRYNVPPSVAMQREQETHMGCINMHVNRGLAIDIVGNVKI